MAAKIDTVADFTPRGLGELKAWLETWFHPHEAVAAAGGSGSGIDFNIVDLNQDSAGADARFLSLETIEDSELVMKTRTDLTETHAAYRFISAAVGGFNVQLSNESSFLLEQLGSGDGPADFVDARLTAFYLVGSGSPFVTDPAPSAYAGFQLVNNSDANFEILNTGDGAVSVHNTDGALLLTTSGGDITLAATNIGRIVMISDQLIISGLPTSSPGGSGRVWNSAGTLKIT